MHMVQRLLVVIKPIIVLFVCITFVYGTTSYSDAIDSPDDSTVSLEEEIKILKIEVETLSALFNIHKANFTHEPSVIAFDPANPGGFQIVDAGITTFLVQIDHIEPYLTGYKVHFQIGNKDNATYSDPTVKVSWAPSRPKTLDKLLNSDWMSNIQEREKKIPKDLLPGTWTACTLLVTPATPETFGYLSLSVQVEEIKLFIE